MIHRREEPREKPIIFSTSMVEAILAGFKTQTRRLMTPQPYRDTRQFPLMAEPNLCWVWNPKKDIEWFAWDIGDLDGDFDPMIDINGPYHPGDRLWVRETYITDGSRIHYKANHPYPAVIRWNGPWLPAIFMPKSLSRITLEVLCIRAERLQDISMHDALSEGIEVTGPRFEEGSYCIGAFADLWDTIHAKRKTRRCDLGIWPADFTPYTWENNPWVWVLEFRISKERSAFFRQSAFQEGPCLP
jgi:hypothetical protein